MKDISFIQTSLWNDITFTSMSPEHKLIMLFLLQGTQTNWCGIFKLNIAMMGLSIGLREKNIESAFKAFLLYYEDLVAYDEGTGEVAILNWGRMNIVSMNGKSMTSAKANLLEIESEDLILKIIEKSKSTKAVEFYTSGLNSIRMSAINKAKKLEKLDPTAPPSNSLIINVLPTKERKGKERKEKEEEINNKKEKFKSLNSQMEIQARQDEFRVSIRRLVKDYKKHNEDWKDFFGGTSKLARLTNEIAYEMAKLDYQGEIKDYIWGFIRNGRNEMLWEEEVIEPKSEVLKEDPFGMFDTPAKARDVWAMWMRYKSKYPYASSEVKEIAFTDFKEYSCGSAASAEEMVKSAMKAGYRDFYEPKEKPQPEAQNVQEVKTSRNTVLLYLHGLRKEWEEKGESIGVKPYMRKIQPLAAEHGVELDEWITGCLKYLECWDENLEA